MASVEATKRKRERQQRRAERAASREKAQQNGRDVSKKSEKPPKSTLREWFDALFFAFIVMLIVRTLIFDLFRIPTPSMEKSLLIGDYLFVSKLHYGTRLPMSIGIPFTQYALQGIDLPYTRVPGFSEVERGDAVVFNYPVEDKAVDRKTHYIKRVVGLPGETVRVKDKEVLIDGVPQSMLAGMQQYWYVYKKDQRVRLSEARMLALGVEEVAPTTDLSIERILATEKAVEEVRKLRYVERVEPAIAPANAGYSPLMYPPNRGFTPDNYGPVTIPKQGETITLTADNWLIYETVIKRYEGHTVRRLGEDAFEIDGQPVTTYTFEQDYYFVMGDNRDNSEDSRFWGFVPFDHVVGKAVLIYFSWDQNGSPFLFGQIRFDRLFSFVQ